MSGDDIRETMPASELALIALAQHDPAAFGQLYERHVDAIYRYIAHRLGPGPEAEDLTGAVFLRALDALPRFRWQGVGFRHWLYRIAGNIVRDYWRRRRTILPLDAAVAVQAATPGPPEVAEEHELQAQVRALVRTLPEAQQAAVVLRFGQELSYAEVGAVLGKSESAARQLVHRAVTALRNKLGGGADASI